MSNIDKQWLQQKIADMEATRDEIPFGLDEDDSNTLVALRIALASLEAEPVAWTDADELRDAQNGGSGYLFAIGGDANKFADPRRQLMLYTTAPAPIVPCAWEQWIADAVEYLEGGLEADGELEAEGSIEAKRLLSRRAAMLQGAEPSKISGIMPDHEGGVMTQRELFQAGWEAHRAAMHRAGAPVQFGWSKGHFGYHTLFNAICKAVNIQGGALSISVSAFEDAMLAAAPQQEVKQCT